MALILYNGCTHKCIYCYNNGRYSKPGEFFKASRPRNFDMKDLARDCRFLRDQYGEAVPEVLNSFIGDAYQWSETHLGKTRLAIKILTVAQIPFTILTKSNAIQRYFDILGDYRDKFRLGVTIITPFEDEAQTWEPGAPSISSRIDTLAEAKRIGIRTRVNLEPAMKVMSAMKLVKQFHHLVDIWAVGKLNHMEGPKPIDWVEAMKEIISALKSVGAKYKFKRSFNELLKTSRDGSGRYVSGASERWRIETLTRKTASGSIS